MTNNRRNHIGAYLMALAVLGCTQAASAVDTTNAHATHGFVGDIEKMSAANPDFRHVLYTAKHIQLVLMSLKPGEDIGAEVHPAVDQFLRVEEGSGEAVLNGVRTPIKAGYAVLVPSGTRHDIVNTGKTPMKLYTLYAPPQHREGIVHHTRAEAEKDHEHFDGKTTQ